MPYILFGDNEGDLCPGKITWYDHVIKSSFKVLIFNL
jgi:hypothetical protein